MRDRATIVAHNTALTNIETSIQIATTAIMHQGGPALLHGAQGPEPESIPKTQEFAGSEDQLCLLIVRVPTNTLTEPH